MKTADQILSCTSDYELKELRDRLSDPIIQPRDAIEAMHQFAAQAVEQRNAEIEELMDIWQERVDYIKKEIASLPTFQQRVRTISIQRTMEECIKEIEQLLPQPPKVK